MVRTNREAMVALTRHHLPEMERGGRGAAQPRPADRVPAGPVPGHLRGDEGVRASFTDALHEEMRRTASP